MAALASDILRRASALFDLTLIIGTLLLLKTALLNIDALWSPAGPVALVAALTLATWSLRRRGKGWADLGMGRPKSFFWTAIWTVVALVVTMGVGILADGLATSLIAPPSEAVQAIDERFSGRFDAVPGNLSAFLFWLAIAWVIGGFVEEMLFRGALFERFETVFSGLPLAAVLAVMCQAALFGHQHLYYQGVAGWVATGAIAVVSGLLYLAFNRNLWPLILSHGLSNTIGLTLIYLGMAG